MKAKKQILEYCGEFSLAGEILLGAAKQARKRAFRAELRRREKAGAALWPAGKPPASLEQLSPAEIGEAWELARIEFCEAGIDRGSFDSLRALALAEKLLGRELSWREAFGFALELFGLAQLPFLAQLEELPAPAWSERSES